MFLKTNKMHYNTIEYRTHFISGANSYMFQHQGAIIRECISNKGYMFNRYFRRYSPLLPS